MQTDHSVKPVRVLVEVRGGNVQAVYADGRVDVQLVDWDNIGNGDAAPRDILFLDGSTAESFMSDDRCVF